MNLVQALLLGLFGWMSSIYSPVLIGGLGGWYTLGRPLVSGAVIGLILGDLQQGIILGAAVQTLYIGLVTPGGTMPADVNYAAWIGIPLAMVAGAGTEYALTLSVPLSGLGVLAVYGLLAVNLYFVHKQDKCIEEGKLEQASNIPVIGQFTNFLFRFVPIFLITYFGSGIMTKIVAMIPQQVTDILQIFSNMLPLVGFMLLVRTLVHRDLDMVLFLFGFVLIVVAQWSIIPVLICALLIAYLNFRAHEA
ncbi:MAG: PTS sugar transporter subunit IIC [Peptoniphilaceae bacterium]|nr:PTS sugar transporter subunit IIC [Peptoniphilaceae bacterium]